MKDRQEITAGDNSTNIQGAKVTVNQYGLTYSEVKEVAMDVFKNNFYDLGEKASEIARARAEEVINDFIEKLHKTSPESINNTEDPDVQFAIYEVQKSYARLGDKEISEILVDVLIQRTMNPSDSFKKLVLNEALTILPKLTTKQIDALSLIYLVKYLVFLPQFKIPFEYYYSILQPFLAKIEVSKVEMLYQHLQYSGCVSISIGSLEFDEAMTHKFPHLFKNYEDLLSVLSLYPPLMELKDPWDNSKLCSCSLTSVGIAIALSNLKVKMDYDWDLSLWINES